MGATLIELHVRDLGVIDDVTVEFEAGTTALTGETGAGKTLLVGALSLLLGGRGDPSMVRTGAEEALVEARFFDPDGPDGGTEIVLARSVAAEGRSRAWVDGRMATMAGLTEAAADLLELHGQHQHRTLIHPEAQRSALDAFGAIDTAPLMEARRRCARLEEESRSLQDQSDHRQRELELLAHHVEEIRTAAIVGPDEDDDLADEETRLANASDLRETAERARQFVGGDDRGSATGGAGGGAIDALASASAALAGQTPLRSTDDRIRGVMGELADVVAELRQVVEQWEDDPVRLAEVRARRSLLHDLRRRHGPTLTDVLEYAEQSEAEIAALASAEQRARSVDADLEAARAVLVAEEAAVARARRAVAPLLAAEIESTLHQLAMPSARFSITVDGEGAGDHVIFELAANPGEAAQPLAKAASGGELARAMLALRLALTEAPGVLVFDEVDAGIGGEAATAVGAALAGLGQYAQVLVVTHLAQVAAMADHQIGVRKIESEGRTRSEVAALDGDDRVVEVSRMLSGSPDSQSAQLHARELLGLGSPTSR